MSQTVQVTEIVDHQEQAFNGLDKTWFKTIEGQVLYIFHKPGNDPHSGDTMVGTIMSDKRQQLKFTKDKQSFNTVTPNLPVPAPTLPPSRPSSSSTSSASPSASSPLPPSSPARTFKADPDKMKQDFSLEKAKNMSIQRQVALKGAVDLIVAGCVAYTGLHEAYTGLMELLSEPDWTKFRPVRMAETEPPYEDNPDPNDPPWGDIPDDIRNF